MAQRLLYLVRHGAYDSDPGNPVDGGTLNETGRQQASLLADRLSGFRFDALHYSTALRAVQTADLLGFALGGVPRHEDELLRECIPTVPDPDTLTEGQREFFAQLPDEVCASGPVQAKAALDRYTAPSETDTRELVVSHGNLINFFVARAMDAPAHGWLRPLDYHCGLTVIRYSDSAAPRVLSYNDVGHLPESLRGIEYPAELRV